MSKKYSVAVFHNYGLMGLDTCISRIFHAFPWKESVLPFGQESRKTLIRIIDFTSPEAKAPNGDVKSMKKNCIFEDLRKFWNKINPEKSPIM